MTISASRARSLKVCLTRSGPSGRSNGLPRWVPSSVPPRGSIPRSERTSRGMVRCSMHAVPGVEEARRSRRRRRVSPLRTMARMTALSPGQSPPPVSTPTRTPRHGRGCGRRDGWPGASGRHRPATNCAVAWDSSRPVPWKRLFTFVGIYSLIVFGLFAVLQARADARVAARPGVRRARGPDGDGGADQVRLAAHHAQVPGPDGRAACAAAGRAGREEEQPRAVRQGGAGRQGGLGQLGGDDGAPRPKPPPTKRTTPGPTNNPRRTRANRKR